MTNGEVNCEVKPKTAWGLKSCGCHRLQVSSGTCMGKAHSLYAQCRLGHSLAEMQKLFDCQPGAPDPPTPQACARSGTRSRRHRGPHEPSDLDDYKAQGRTCHPGDGEGQSSAPRWKTPQRKNKLSLAPKDAVSLPHLSVDQPGFLLAGFKPPKMILYVTQ